ncbi:MAG: hypothetical protein H8D97_00885 [Proteobacteria bacterium]|nr:hypothetical protein [Pseudomonadota bacterium]
MLELIIEEATKTIPPRMQEQLKDTKVRKDMTEAYGKEVFLGENNDTYPVVNPETGMYRSDLIYSAYIRARMQGNSKVANKAKELFESKGCEKELNIKIQDINVSLIDITEMMFVDELGKETLNWIE